MWIKNCIINIYTVIFSTWKLYTDNISYSSELHFLYDNHIQITVSIQQTLSTRKYYSDNISNAKNLFG